MLSYSGLSTDRNSATFTINLPPRLDTQPSTLRDYLITNLSHDRKRPPTVRTYRILTSKAVPDPESDRSPTTFTISSNESCTIARPTGPLSQSAFTAKHLTVIGPSGRSGLPGDGPSQWASLQKPCTAFISSSDPKRSRHVLINVFELESLQYKTDSNVRAALTLYQPAANASITPAGKATAYTVYGQRTELPFGWNSPDASKISDVIVDSWALKANSWSSDIADQVSRFRPAAESRPNSAMTGAENHKDPHQNDSAGTAGRTDTVLWPDNFQNTAVLLLDFNNQGPDHNSKMDEAG